EDVEHDFGAFALRKFEGVKDRPTSRESGLSRAQQSRDGRRDVALIPIADTAWRYSIPHEKERDIPDFRLYPSMIAVRELTVISGEEDARLRSRRVHDGLHLGVKPIDLRTVLR